MSTALYRRYRSARFSDLIGQPQLVATLLSELRTDRLAHAYLFAGIRGTGKTSTARILARAINCLDSADVEPCNECPACREILGGAAVDVLEIDAASNRGIDDVRELRERVNYLPASLRRKVYIIDEAHMLTTDAWNAFLKTLEEPPSHVLFILATTEPHKVPETVRSRLQRFDFRRVSTPKIAAHLSGIAGREGIEVDADAAALLARAGQGSVRDALSLLDQALATGDRPVTAASVRRALGFADVGVVRQLVTGLSQREGAVALRSAAAAFEAGADPQQLIREISRLARAAAFTGMGYPEGAPAEPADEDLARQLAHAAPPDFWVDALELLGTAELNLRQPVDARLQVEMCLLRLLHPTPVRGMPDVDVEKRVAFTEGMLPSGSVPEFGRTANPGPTPDPRSEPDSQRSLLTPAIRNLSPPGTDPEAPIGLDVAARGAQPPVAVGDQGLVQAHGMDDWNAAWPRLIDAIDRRDFMLAGLLKSCRPVEGSGDRLVIGALHRFHLEQIGVEAKARILREVATELAGRPVFVETVYIGAPPASAPKVDDLATTALETFSGSRIVGSRPREGGRGEAPARKDGPP